MGPDGNYDAEANGMIRVNNRSEIEKIYGIWNRKQGFPVAGEKQRKQETGSRDNLLSHPGFLFHG